MYLICEDKLFAGPGRMLFVTTDDLGPDEGLVEILETGVEEEDPAFVPQGPEDKPKTRELFELLLRGRPDLRPGIIVVFLQPAHTDRWGSWWTFRSTRALSPASRRCRSTCAALPITCPARRGS